LPFWKEITGGSLLTVINTQLLEVSSAAGFVQAEV
jgi:hypothetical protein